VGGVYTAQAGHEITIAHHCTGGMDLERLREFVKATPAKVLEGYKKSMEAERTQKEAKLAKEEAKAAKAAAKKAKNVEASHATPASSEL
jgi:hypothetical protein